MRVYNTGPSSKTLMMHMCTKQKEQTKEKSHFDMK